MSKIFEGLERADKHPADGSRNGEPEAATAQGAGQAAAARLAAETSGGHAATTEANEPGNGHDPAQRPADKDQPLQDLTATGEPVAAQPESKIALMLTQTSIAAEQYRVLRATLLDRRERDGLKCVVVGSPGPGDGKTITALNVAIGFAQLSPTRVLLMEADLRRPAASRYLGLPARQGLPEYLTSAISLEEAIIPTGIPGLWLMPSRAMALNQTEVLHSPRLTAAFAQLRKQFDWVIVDGPPLTLVADHYLLAAHCDGILLVVRPMHTSRDLLQSAAQSVNTKKLLGVVLNATSVPYQYKGSYGYGYGYGYAPEAKEPKSRLAKIWRKNVR